MNLYGFGAMDVTKPHEFTWFGDTHGPKPYKCIGLRWAFISQTPVVLPEDSAVRAPPLLSPGGCFSENVNGFGRFRPGPGSFIAAETLNGPTLNISIRPVLRDGRGWATLCCPVGAWTRSARPT